MKMFFYGTMMDPDVRRLVLGPSAAGRLQPLPASLPGHRRVLARHGRFPVLVRRGAGRVEGLLVADLQRRDVERIAHFEGPHYEPVKARVWTLAASRRRSTAVWLLLPVNRADARSEPWELRRWQITEKRRLLADLAVWMKEYERLGAHSVDISWPVRRLLAAFPAEEEG